MTIAAILSGKGNEVASIASDAPLSQAVAELGTRRIGALLVMDGGEISGILSERDLIYCLTAHGAEVLDWPVSRAMTTPPIVIAPDIDVLSALALMTQRRIRHLPVVSLVASSRESSRSATWSNIASSGSRPKPRRCGPIFRQRKGFSV